MNVIPDRTGKYLIRCFDPACGEEFVTEHWFFADEGHWQVSGLRKYPADARKCRLASKVLEVIKEIPQPETMPDAFDNNYILLVGAMVRQSYDDYLKSEKHRYSLYWRRLAHINEWDLYTAMLDKERCKGNNLFEEMLMKEHFNEYVKATVERAERNAKYAPYTGRISSLIPSREETIRNCNF